MNKCTNLDKIIGRQLGAALWAERQKKGTRLNTIRVQTGLAPELVDRIELGKAIIPVSIKKLLAFYKKKIKIELID